MAELEEFGRSEPMTRTLIVTVTKPAGHRAVLSRSPLATQWDSRVSAFCSPTPSPHTLDGAVVNYPGGGVLPCHQVECFSKSLSPQRSDCGGIALEAPTSPLINIKDEPIDEDYDAALLPQSSSRQVKEELENQEDELRISSVYSVGGEPSYSAPSVAGPTTHTPSIFGPGRSLAPAPLVQPPPPPLAPPPPDKGGSSANISCSGCSKVLLKGQTAFQKKGSTQLFCSTVCLTGFLPPTVPARPCFQCLKEIDNPMNVPSVVVDKNLKDFCSPVCLFTYNCQKKTDPPDPELPFCSSCKKSNEVQHEVIYHGEVHKLCSDDCFLTWRCNRNLAINFCESCGMYCSSKGGGCQNLTIGDVNLRFCSPTCISTYKQTCSKLMKCSHCGNEAMVSTMLVSNDPLGKVKLYCSATCVSYSRPPQHILSGMSTNPLPPPQPDLPQTGSSLSGTSTNPPAPPQPDLPGTGSSPCGLSPLSSSRPAAPGHPDTPSQTSAAPCASTPGSSRPYEQPQQGLIPLSTSRFSGPITLHKSCFHEPSSRPELLHKESPETDAVAHHWDMKNEAFMCRPFTHSQETLCNLPTQTTHTPAGFSGCSFTTTINEEKVKVVILPIPVPVFIPMPMNMYSQCTPVPMPMPIPVPVPVVLPSAPTGSQSKDTHDPLVQSQGIAEEVEEVEKDKPVSHGDQGSTYSGDLESEAISTPLSWEEESNPASSSQRGGGPVAVDPPSTSEPGAMDLEADIPTEWCDPSKRAVVRRLAGCKRPREGFSPGKRSRKRVCSEEGSHTVSSSRTTKLHYVYGVQAWRNWVLQRKRQPDSESTSKSDGPAVLKEDFLQCDSAELSDGLCHFITEVRRPNGGPYTPDSIFYLCLGIQLYLFENGRIENIFTDELYSRFTVEITRILERWRPTLTPSGYLCSRVEEDYLWECKQLGTYSPIVLLNTLLFFSTKTFRFTDAGQHRRLSFANFTHCTRSPGKIDYLRFRPPHRDQGTSELLPVSPGKRKMEEEEEDMEMPENRENPLHCPVQLYEFYLSKCSESVKNRDDLFYLQPLVSCHPDSPRWFSSQPLDGATLDSMLTRILAVRQVHLDEGSEASTDDGGGSP